MYATPPKTHTARKQHRCTNCAEHIEPGTQYERWMSVDGGKVFTNKMHPECLASLAEDCVGGWFEYTLYSGERPIYSRTRPKQEVRGC